MARIELRLPQSLPFTTEIDVRVTDMNYGSHLGNDAMLSLIHEARWRFFRSNGMTEGDVCGARLVLADAAIVYKKEAFAGDRLRFEVGVFDVALVAEAKTGLVFLDPASGRPIAVPDRIRALAVAVAE